MSDSRNATGQLRQKICSAIDLLEQPHDYKHPAKVLLVEALALLSQSLPSAEKRTEVLRLTEVVGQDGSPVAAPCAISGCALMRVEHFSGEYWIKDAKDGIVTAVAPKYPRGKAENEAAESAARRIVEGVNGPSATSTASTSPLVAPHAGYASVDIVFDGPPDRDAPRFVEVESPPGTGISFGEWVQREDGYWALRFTEAMQAPSTGEGMSNEERYKRFGTLLPLGERPKETDAEIIARSSISASSGGTPRTDDVASNYPGGWLNMNEAAAHYNMMLDLARELERELAEATRFIKAMGATLGCGPSDSIADRLEQVMRDRSAREGNEDEQKRAEQASYRVGYMDGVAGRTPQAPLLVPPTSTDRNIK